MQAALLKMATPAVTFGTVCPIFCRVNAIFLAHSPKTSGGPGPPREVVLARLKSGPRTRVSAIFFLLRLKCFVQPAKNYADTLLIDKSGWLFEGILCEGLGNSCKNARWLNTLRVPFLVQGCLLEINVETNWPYFCRVNDAGLALDLRPVCQNLGAPTPKWMSSPIYTTLTLQLRHWHYNYLQVNFIHLPASIQSEKLKFT